MTKAIDALVAQHVFGYDAPTLAAGREPCFGGCGAELCVACAAAWGHCGTPICEQVAKRHSGAEGKP